MKSLQTLGIGLAMTTAAFMGGNAFGCTRVLYEGNDSVYIVGRSLDWKTPIPTNLYVYPRGVDKVSSDQPGAITWTSKYGAVYAVGYDGGVTEGMNECGLVINGLFCKGTVYENEDTRNRPPMSMAMFVAWLLDNNSTVDECVKVLEAHNFNIGGATFDGGTVSALHWGMTDASGKTAILEFDNGVVRIYYPDNIRAMSNDPQWPAMKAIVEYWDAVGGANMLPGTVRSADRCVRANFFAHNVEKTDDANLAVSITRSILQVSSVPYLYTVNGEPNVSSTQWRSFSDIKNRRFYFDIVTNPGMYYIDLAKCNLKPGAPVMKLDTKENTTLVGEANKHMKKSAPFTPMY